MKKEVKKTNLATEEIKVTINDIDADKLTVSEERAEEIKRGILLNCVSKKADVDAAIERRVLAEALANAGAKEEDISIAKKAAEKAEGQLAYQVNGKFVKFENGSAMKSLDRMALRELQHALAEVLVGASPAVKKVMALAKSSTKAYSRLTMKPAEELDEAEGKADAAIMAFANAEAKLTKKEREVYAEVRKAQREINSFLVKHNGGYSNRVAFRLGEEEKLGWAYESDFKDVKARGIGSRCVVAYKKVNGRIRDLEKVGS